jgi:hypothetical protein
MTNFDVIIHIFLFPYKYMHKDYLCFRTFENHFCFCSEYIFFNSFKKINCHFAFLIYVHRYILIFERCLLYLCTIVLMTIDKYGKELYLRCTSLFSNWYVKVFYLPFFHLIHHRVSPSHSVYLFMRLHRNN